MCYLSYHVGHVTPALYLSLALSWHKIQPITLP